MPFLDPSHPLQSAIVEVLGTRPKLTVPEIAKALEDEHDLPTSTPTLYRILAQMVDDQVLVREKKTLSLNFLWLTQLIRLADAVKFQYVTSSPDLVRIPKKDGEKVEYEADSLADLDPVWNHILVQVSEARDADGLYEYASHPYYYLGKREAIPFYESFTKEKMNVYVVHGNDTFLDHVGTRLLRMAGVQAAAVSSSPFPKEGYMLSIWGDYVVHCIFPPIIASQFAYFFQTVRSTKQFEPELFAEIFHMRARCKLTVRKSRKEAEALRMKIRPLLQAGKPVTLPPMDKKILHKGRSKRSARPSR